MKKLLFMILLPALPACTTEVKVVRDEIAYQKLKAERQLEVQKMEWIQNNPFHKEELVKVCNDKTDRVWSIIDGPYPNGNYQIQRNKAEEVESVPAQCLRRAEEEFLVIQDAE